MKKKWNLLFLFAFIVSMITLAGCGKTAGEASPYEGKWIAVSAQMIGMSVSVDETFGGAFEFEVKNDDDKVIKINKERKEIACFNYYDGFEYLTLEELQAINKKVEELGWK